MAIDLILNSEDKVCPKQLLQKLWVWVFFKHLLTMSYIARGYRCLWDLRLIINC